MEIPFYVLKTKQCQELNRTYLIVWLSDNPDVDEDYNIFEIDEVMSALAVEIDTDYLTSQLLINKNDTKAIIQEFKEDLYERFEDHIKFLCEITIGAAVIQMFAKLVGFIETQVIQTSIKVSKSLD